ncbi:MAG: hypothetical protein OXC83_10085 [Chloroflexi bacterium]|nr:hypothetical protein [Chloroflexota bacterium]
MKELSAISDIADVFQGIARAGRGAGSRQGDWQLKIVESNDVRDDKIDMDGLGEIEVAQNQRTERHLIRPYDVLVTARAGNANIGLVPSEISRTVASVTMLVVRPIDPASGMGHWLWYYLTSDFGRTQIARRISSSATLKSLSAKSMAEIEVPVPTMRELNRIARLVEASEATYHSAVEAANIRRVIYRNAVVNAFELKANKIAR